jgi:predicted dehydrogenase
MSLINHAAGLNLPASHWFWDKSHSGGIWIEHGVHFFDAFAWVAGHSGEIASARHFTRADGVVDRVEALATYGSSAAHFYHGFTHGGATEQTIVTLAFERAHLTLREWVPTVLELVTPLQLDPLIPFMPGVVETGTVSATMRRLTATLPEGKAAVYRAAIQAGMTDLARAVRNPRHTLSVTGTHGLDSLRMAVDAEAQSAASRGAVRH